MYSILGRYNQLSNLLQYWHGSCSCSVLLKKPTRLVRMFDIFLAKSVQYKYNSMTYYLSILYCAFNIQWYIFVFSMCISIRTCTLYTVMYTAHSYVHHTMQVLYNVNCSVHCTLFCKRYNTWFLTIYTVFYTLTTLYTFLCIIYSKEVKI